MTPLERADKIRRLLNDPWGDGIANDIIEDVINFVEVQIEEAQREAVLKELLSGKGIKDAYAEGFAAARAEDNRDRGLEWAQGHQVGFYEARDKARGIVENLPDCSPGYCAQRIAEMRAEEK